MTLLLLASIVFVAIHVLPSTPLRAAVIGRTGELAWTVGFSIASIAGIIWMVKAWGAAAPSEMLYGVGAGLRHGAALLVFLALTLAVLGLSTPGDPSQAGPARGKTGERAARGVRRITRHPFLFGAGLWAVVHMAVNPNARDWIFFGAFAVLSFGGALAQDRRHRRTYGDGYEHYLKQTSFVPFAAIAAGRNHLSFAEIGVWRLVLCVVVFAGLLLGHAHLFGVSPLG